MVEIPNTNNDRHRNCGSYALNCKEWFSFNFWINYGIKEQEYQFYLIHAARDILKRFPRLKMVDRDYVDANPNKTIIAFRFSEWDWHFIVRRNHSWRGKMGSFSVFKYTKDEVLNQPWTNECGDVYDSEIIFFAYR